MDEEDDDDEMRDLKAIEVALLDTEEEREREKEKAKERNNDENKTTIDRIHTIQINRD